MTSMKLDPLDIETTAGTQSRHAYSQAVIDEYANDMRNGDLFPQIVVFAEPGSERRFLADGFHRLPAWLSAKPGELIACDVREGTIVDAKEYAIRANAEHGSRRTPADVRHCIRMALLEPEWEGRANTVVSKMVKCHRETVSKVREEMTIAGELGDSNKRTHIRDGKEVKATVGDKPKRERKAKSDPEPKGNGRSQDSYDREEILTAVTTLTQSIVNGSDAVERYDLYDNLERIKAARDWLNEAVAAIEAVKSKPATSDESAFLNS